MIGSLINYKYILNQILLSIYFTRLLQYAAIYTLLFSSAWSFSLFESFAPVVSYL